MSDLNIVRLGSLEDGDEPSHEGPQSYNSWRYGDEASLYSIAEDSREDHQSSQATDSRMSSSQQQQPPSLLMPRADLPDAEEDSPIEVRWVTAEELALAEGGGREREQEPYGGAAATGGIIPLPTQDPDEMASQEEHDDEEPLGPRHNARRSALFLLLLMCAVIVIVLSLTLALRNNKDSNPPPPRVSGGVRDPDADPQTPSYNPSGNGGAVATNPGQGTDPQSGGVDPTQPQVTSPTTPFTPNIIDPYSLVWDAITSCPQTNPDDLTNESTNQMEVFETIVLEVTKLITTDERGSQTLDTKVGKGWILEKWALLMLFFDTEGEYWDNLDNWYSFEDTCTWYNQASGSPCDTREAGGSALTKLVLGMLFYYSNAICAF